MSKASKKAAKMAAKQVKKNNTVVQNEVKTPDVEQKKEEKVEPAVEQPKAEQPKKVEEPKKEEKPVPTVEEIKEEKKEQPKKKEEKKKEKKVPTFIPEDATHELAQVQKKSSGIPQTTSTVDAKARIMSVIWERYGKNQDFAKQYPEAYDDLMRNLDAVTVLSLVDLRNELKERNEAGELKLTVSADQVMPLQNIAAMLGIELTPLAALPGKEEDKKQLKLEFVPEELKDKQPKSGDKPELDPSKITTEEQVKAALEWELRCSAGSNMAINLANTVQWYRDYCMFKEQDADKKLKLDEKPVSEWMNEIFHKIQPVALLKGLGRALYLYTKRDGSPIVAHTTLHHHLAPLGYSEEAIAEFVRTLIQEQFRYNLATDEKSEKDPKKDIALMAVTKNLGNDYIDKVFNDYAIASNVEDNLQREKKARANEIIGRVRTNYVVNSEKKDFTLDEIRMAIGRIINLYRDPMNPLTEYLGESYSSAKEGEYPAKKVTVEVNIKKK